MAALFRVLSESERGEKMKYFAHISKDNREQTVLEHLNATAELCSKFAEPFGAEQLGRFDSFKAPSFHASFPARGTGIEIQTGSAQ